MRQSQLGLYAQDQMRLGPWLAVLGVRQDFVTNNVQGSPAEDTRATTGRAGLMYELPFGRYGHALWAYIGGRFGDEVVGDMLRAGGLSRGGYEVAFEGVLQVKTADLSKEWHDTLFQAYRPIAEATKMPADIGRPVIKKRREGELNVSPEISPDGSRMMFFSERDLFSIDLYMADARTGKVLRKITDTATRTHTESLQFIASAGAWDKTSKSPCFLVSPEDSRCSQSWTSSAGRRSGKSPRRRRRSASTRPGRPTATRSRSPAWPAASPTCSSTT